MSRNRQARPCQARKSDGTQCKGYAITGGLVCGAHGGRAPQVKAAAQRRAAEQAIQEQAARELAKFSDAPPVRNPLEALAKLAGEAEAWKQACERRVQALKEVRYESSMRLEQLRAEVQLYTEAVRLCHAINASAGRLNVDERLMAIREGQARMVADALSHALATGGITGDAAVSVRRDFAARMRVLPRDAESA